MSFVNRPFTKLVYIWASEVSPILGSSIEISRDIYMYVVRSVCLKETHTKNGMPKCVGRIMWFKHAPAQSQFCEFETKCHFKTLILPSSGRSKPTCDTRIIHFYYTLE